MPRRRTHSPTDCAALCWRRGASPSPVHPAQSQNCASRHRLQSHTKLASGGHPWRSAQRRTTNGQSLFQVSSSEGCFNPTPNFTLHHCYNPCHCHAYSIASHNLDTTHHVILLHVYPSAHSTRWQVCSSPVQGSEGYRGCTGCTGCTIRPPVIV